MKLKLSKRDEAEEQPVPEAQDTDEGSQDNESEKENELNDYSKNRAAEN